MPVSTEQAEKCRRSFKQIGSAVAAMATVKHDPAFEERFFNWTRQDPHSRQAAHFLQASISSVRVSP